MQVKFEDFTSATWNFITFLPYKATIHLIGRANLNCDISQTIVLGNVKEEIIFVKIPASTFSVFNAGSFFNIYTRSFFIINSETSTPYFLANPTFFFNDTASTEIYTLPLHAALPI